MQERLIDLVKTGPEQSMASTTVNMLEAKCTLSKLVHELEQGLLDEVVIARKGRPAARLLPLATSHSDRARRLGVARGRFEVPDPPVEVDDGVLGLFAP